MIREGNNRWKSHEWISQHMNSITLHLINLTKLWMYTHQRLLVSLPQQDQLQTFWQRQHVEIIESNDFKNHNLPLARIKKIMKADEDVRMISSEALVLFARACEIFILELTLRAWSHTEENKRRTLQKNDLAVAITRTDVFDFLVDIVPRDEVKDGLVMSVPGVGGPSDAVPYYYLPAPVGSSGMIVGGGSVDQSLIYAQQPYTHLPQQTGPPQQEQLMMQQELPPSNA